MAKRKRDDRKRRAASSSSNSKDESSWSWPKYASNPTFTNSKSASVELQQKQKQWPKGHLLNGLDEVIWDALAHVDPKLFAKSDGGKQVAIRKALDLCNMGWVATNCGTRTRTAVGHFYDAARFFFQRHDFTRPKKEKVRKVEIKEGTWKPTKMADGEYINASGELEFVVYKDGRKEGTKKDETDCKFPKEVCDSIRKSIAESGMVIIRGAIDKQSIAKLRFGGDVEGCHPAAKELEKVDRGIKTITGRTGNGSAGEATFSRITAKGTESIGSYYCDLLQSDYLDSLQTILVASLKPASDTHENVSEMSETVSKMRKYIWLQYSEGGENWAHRDDNSDEYFPYQALLMLSNSDDYDGGQFYVAKQITNKDGTTSVVRTCCPSLDAGDLVVFQADKEGDYDHGMLTVTSGERVAIGLLQKSGR